MKRRLDFWSVVKFACFALMLVFLVYPFFSMFAKSIISPEGGVTFDNFAQFFKLKYYYSTLKNSLSICITVTLTCLALGIPMAYCATRYNLIGKSVMNVMIIMSLMSPPFIGAYSWIVLLGRNGALTKFLTNLGINMPSIYGWGGIVLVFTIKLFPYVYLYVSGALGSIDSSLEEASESLGSGKFRRIMTVTLPVVMPTILSSGLMVFMTSLADFGTPMLIGEGYKVLPVLIYEEYISEVGTNAGMASTLSVIIVLCSTFVLLLQNAVVMKKNYNMSALRPPAVIKLRPIPRVLISFACILVAFLGFLPQIVVVVSSFRKTSGPIFTSGFSLNSYRDIAYKLSQNIKNTFTFSITAIILIVIFGMLVAYLSVKRRSKTSTLLDTMVMFPYVIPGAVLGIAFLSAFNKPPIVLAGTPIIMIVAYVVRKLPYTVRSTSGILYQIDSSIEEASISLGRSPMKTFFTVTARLMAPGVISGAILSWISTINELSSSIMLYSGRTGTISVAIYNEVARGGFGTAAALASILTLVTLLSLLLFQIISKGKVSIV
ncbi:MAG TPA: iron ABC transporter permease [Clostridiales bacterium]|nr:iron ABC transporter permease [Clostridiales bacterium]